jgi:hypothetical protein
VMLEPASLCESSHTRKHVPASLDDTKRRPAGNHFPSNSVRMSPAVTTTTRKLQWSYQLLDPMGGFVIPMDIQRSHRSKRPATFAIKDPRVPLQQFD